MIGEEQFFKVIKDELGRAVLITLNFVDNHFHFLVYLMLGESTVENNICQQLYCTRKVFCQKSAVNHRFFFIGIGIEVSAHIFHTVQYMPGVSFLCTFKDKVFYKMRHSLLLFIFITCSGIYRKTAIGYFREVGCMNNTQPV